MKIVRDGNAYCVQADNFVNLQESDDYFFIDEEEFAEWARSRLAALLDTARSTNAGMLELKTFGSRDELTSTIVIVNSPKMAEQISAVANALYELETDRAESAKG